MTDVKLLTREDIERNSQLKTLVVHVPEWGGAVMIRELTGAERDDYESSITGYRITREKNKSTTQELHLKNVRARLAVKCLINADGTRMYSDSEVNILGNKSAAGLKRVVEACERLSGITEEEMTEIEAELKENGTAVFGTP